MRFVNIGLVLFVVVAIEVTAGSTLGSRTRISLFGNYMKRVVSNFVKERRTSASVNNNHKRNGVTFDCDSYFSVSDSLTVPPDRNIIDAMRDIFEDKRITKEELTNMTMIICQSFSDIADALEVKYADCPNLATINGSMKHLGPMCLRSGTLTTFATNLLTNFTEVTPTASCNSYVLNASRKCRVTGGLIFESTGYTQDLSNATRIVKDRYRCVFGNLNNAHDCGNIDDLQRAYLIIGSPLILKPGLVYNMEDFF